jgi:predicted O-methyltransferase YrrM
MMSYLEAIDARDRQDGTPMARRMRQILPETGRFLALQPFLDFVAKDRRVVSVVVLIGKGVLLCRKL